MWQGNGQHQEKLIYLDKAIMAFLAEQLHNKAIQAFLNQSPWQRKSLSSKPCQ